MKGKIRFFWKEIWRQIKNTVWNYFHPFGKWRSQFYFKQPTDSKQEPLSRDSGFSVFSSEVLNFEMCSKIHFLQDSF